MGEITHKRLAFVSDGVLKPAEAAKRLGYKSGRTVRDLCRDGKLAFTRAGNELRIPVAAIDRYLAQNLVIPGEEEPQSATLRRNRRSA